MRIRTVLYVLGGSCLVFAALACVGRGGDRAALSLVWDVSGDPRGESAAGAADEASDGRCACGLDVEDAGHADRGDAGVPSPAAASGVRAADGGNRRRDDGNRTATKEDGL